MNVLNKTQISNLKICGRKLAQVLALVKKKIVPGVVISTLDELAEKELIALGCVPAFKNYFVEGIGSYPATLCISINDEIVHGIPSDKRIIAKGDVVSLDIGAGFEGIYTDMATTVAVEPITAEVQKLIDGTKEALKSGIEQAILGHHIGDIGAAVEAKANQYHLGIIRDYVGHGIGEKPHLPPQIPNFGIAGTGVLITEGMALAIEPMLTLGGEKTIVSSNGWTVKTADKSMAAHFEHTIIIENGKPVIVTKE